MNEKLVQDYCNKPYRIEIIPDPYEGGYTVAYPELPGCVTCGETLESALKNAEDAKREWIYAALEDGQEIPEPMSEDYSGQFRIRMPKSLHKDLALTAQKEGISMNQYCIYLLTRELERKKSS